MTRDYFHVIPPEAGAAPVRVVVPGLKAVFFVKDHAGDRHYSEKKAFQKLVPGRKLQVIFKDGETLVGATTAYEAGRPGFFMTPADPKSNNDRIYIVMPKPCAPWPSSSSRLGQRQQPGVDRHAHHGVHAVRPSSSISSRVVMPPAAVTWRDVARATSRIASMSVPCISPSRSTWVYRNSLQYGSRVRTASTAVIGSEVFHPWITTGPALLSTAPMMR